jgi:phosphonate transport system substrate-binding protein
MSALHRLHLCRRTSLRTNASQENQLNSSWGGRRLALCAALLILASVAGCKSKSAPQSTLRISMVPTTDPGKALRENQPLLAYWKKQTGRTPVLTIPTSYAPVVEALANDKVDIAFLGGFTYVQASARSGVRPLVQRSIDQQFQSVFITPATSKIHSLADLHGHFIFGDVNSTSGHLMPLYYMQQAKVDPAVIENASYSGGHDATALAIANGKAEAGAMDELVYKKMVANGQLKPGAVRVFYITPPFFDYVWVANKDLDPKIASAFADSMKALSPTKPDQQALLDLLNAKSYVAANDADYGKLRDAAKSAGLLH